MRIALFENTGSKIPNFLQPYYRAEEGIFGNSVDTYMREELAMRLEKGDWQDTDVSFDDAEGIANYLRLNRESIYREEGDDGVVFYRFWKPRINKYNMALICIVDVDTSKPWTIISPSYGPEYTISFEEDAKTKYMRRISENP